MAHNLKDAIRQAIVCREYQKARKLWTEYMDSLRVELQRGALTQAQMDEAGELLEWARVTVLCRRAHIQQRLRGLQVASVYQAASQRSAFSHRLKPQSGGRLKADC